MSTVTTTNPIDTTTLPEARLAANVAAARSGAEELAAFQTYAQDRTWNSQSPASRTIVRRIVMSC